MGENNKIRPRGHECEELCRSREQKGMQTDPGGGLSPGVPARAVLNNELNAHTLSKVVSYSVTQCAAVSTHASAMSVPPQ